MNSLRSNSTGAIWWATVAVAGLVGSGVTQGNPTDSAPAVAPPQTIAPPSFQTMGQAIQSVDYTVVQLRRFREGQANVVTVRERLQVDANGSNSPNYAVTFLGVEGELPGSPTFQKYQQIYNRMGDQFFEYSFRVRDLIKAQANYTLHHFGTTVRANRTVSLIVVFPQSMDKAIYLLEVDSLTQVPLYAAEFDSQLRLLSEVEALTFVTAVAPPPPPPGGGGSTVHPDYASAETFLGHPEGLIEPIVMLANDYSVERIVSRVDPLNGLQKLVITYTDGVDQFMIAETLGVDDVFAPLAKQGINHTIARYRDPAMSVLLFWEGGVAFQVAGRGALQRLDDLARRLYLQALSSN